MRSDIAAALTLLDEAYDRRAWHGPNLRGSLRGVTAAQAAWRPRTGVHNIWELVVHAAYWKYAVRRRLAGGDRGSFALSGSNWFARPQTATVNEAAWRADLALLAANHRELREVVEHLSAAALHRQLTRDGRSAWALVAGVAAHDIYHAGQIQLLKRLQRTAPSRRGTPAGY